MEEKYLSLLKDVYKAFIRFDNALYAEPRNTQEINIAYTWLHACMSDIFDAINENNGGARKHDP